MFLKTLITSIVCLFVLIACAGPGQGSMTTEIAARQVLSMADCGYMKKQPAIKVLAARKALDQALAIVTRVSGHAVAEQMQVSFAQEVLVQIMMGQKSTGGYSLALIKDSAMLEDGWVVLPVQWSKPAAGMMLTQALTSPCLFVAVPRQQYEGIRVVDQHDKARIQISL